MPVCFLLTRYSNGASIFTTSGVAARKFQTEIEVGQVEISLKHATRQNNRANRKAEDKLLEFLVWSHAPVMPLPC